ncbi:hypothetical protein BCR32DRAFT_275936 [Anaeromyces robustus]|uniref:Chitin-binding type-1 domain-containing protein n=1 Tax=Anaeromyces robustus TaxID=1754192 RepID=A0A1Y1XJC4_9FUNG|nr:hypothetical protein BCR32DRAFT_275936 [Anaeromyces robustus]|eukprot:ORX85851.1 hypothetical protein BCR32DRAFT_275936 [Anaeromyces robustus]
MKCYNITTAILLAVNALFVHSKGNEEEKIIRMTESDTRKNSNIIICIEEGLYCNNYDYCGSIPDYCGKECQIRYGKCDTTTTTTTTKKNDDN